MPVWDADRHYQLLVWVRTLGDRMETPLYFTSYPPLLPEICPLQTRNGSHRSKKGPE